MSKRNFVDISQLMAEIKLLPFYEKQTSPYYKSTFGFDFDHLPENARNLHIILHQATEFRPN